MIRCRALIDAQIHIGDRLHDRIQIAAHHILVFVLIGQTARDQHERFRAALRYDGLQFLQPVGVRLPDMSRHHHVHRLRGSQHRLTGDQAPVRQRHPGKDLAGQAGGEHALAALFRIPPDQRTQAAHVHVSGPIERGQHRRIYAFIDRSHQNTPSYPFVSSFVIRPSDRSVRYLG